MKRTTGGRLVNVKQSQARQAKRLEVHSQFLSAFRFLKSNTKTSNPTARPTPTLLLLLLVGYYRKKLWKTVLKQKLELLKTMMMKPTWHHLYVSIAVFSPYSNQPMNDGYVYNHQVEKRMVPHDQIKGLTEKQLQESFTKTLTAANPNVSKGIIVTQ